MEAIEQMITDYLDVNPNFRNTLKDEQGLKTQLIKNNPFVLRAGKLVNPQTNQVTEIGTWVNQHSRPYLKTIGTGKYLGKYRDTRNENERINNAAQTREVLKTWLEKKGYAFVSDEPVRIWIDQLSKNMLFETDGEDSFVLTALLNGVPTKRFKADELFPLIGQYVDSEKTRLNQLRIDAKIKEEALKLSGLSHQDLSDKKKAPYFEEIESLLKNEYNAQPTKKKLPPVHEDDLKADLQKEAAYSWNLPLEKTAWTLAEKTSLEAIAENAITEATQNAIAPIQKFVAARPAKFYERVFETFPNLPNEINE